MCSGLVLNSEMVTLAPDLYVEEIRWVSWSIRNSPVDRTSTFSEVEMDTRF